MQLLPNSIYRHYKGHQYRIITVATSTDDITEQFVIYEALYANEVSQIWARSLPEFLQMVEVEGRLVPRFTFVEQIS